MAMASSEIPDIARLQRQPVQPGGEIAEVAQRCNGRDRKPDPARCRIDHRMGEEAHDHRMQEPDQRQALGDADQPRRSQRRIGNRRRHHHEDDKERGLDQAKAGEGQTLVAQEAALARLFAEQRQAPCDLPRRKLGQHPSRYDGGHLGIELWRRQPALENGKPVPEFVLKRSDGHGAALSGNTPAIARQACDGRHGVQRSPQETFFACL
ncbi:hypothetical protein [Aestuariivirga sp.]|uniref:hypothetical protein n=1 Tax=Aestuariivirga sp. TaxID=2650926 RepID=UPI0039E51531